MSIPATTPVSIRYISPPGAPAFLGRGTIDPLGIITVTEAAPGQDAWLAENLGELNARSYVILKGLPEASAPALPPSLNLVPGFPDDVPADIPELDSDAPHPGPSKRKVLRGAPDFLAALQDYGLRVYGLELEFDPKAFDPPAKEPAPQLEEAPTELPPAGPPAALPDTTELDEADRLT